MMQDNSPQIGKDVIESLTLGMYEDSRFIFREYIQNSADQIDKARKSGLLTSNEEEIHILINPDERSIIIEDNATGIERDKFIPVLRNIAHSTKTRGEDKGFRGIGRLGGLGYCSNLRFESSYYGEDCKCVMTWDADLLKRIINDRETKEEAVEVLQRVTETKEYQEDVNAHYFRVILDGVTSKELLDADNVREYLSMVAPVDIDSRFLYRNKINQFMRDNGLSLDTYNIYINQEQIYKPYTNCIYEELNGGKKKVDDIIDVEFLLQKNQNDDIIYWGWYTLSQLNGQMKPKNIARGIRLRKENIQIGDEEICKKFFTKTEDQRFSFYYFGEIHAVSKGLIPNSRRDYFSESRECAEFELLIKRDFLNLKELCYNVQRFRSNTKTIQAAEDLHTKIQQKDKTGGYSSKKEREELVRQYEEYRKKSELAKRALAAMSQKHLQPDTPLGNILSRMPQVAATPQQTDTTGQATLPTPRSIYRTDSPLYSKFNRAEKKVIRDIYASITNAIPDEQQREALISKIEADITR